MDRRRFLRLGVAASVALAGCSRSPSTPAPPAADAPTAEPTPREPPRIGVEDPPPDDDRVTDGPVEDHVPDDPEQRIDPELRDRVPQEWGEQVTGVRTRLDTNAAVVALTFDACGGRRGSGYDAALVDHLRREEVPATLFFNDRWVESNPEAFDDLAADPLFEVANHGTEHRPLSVTGREAYGIRGTRSVDEVIAEVMTVQDRLRGLTGDAPGFFRSGTAFYDEVAVEVVEQLGLVVAGFDILGDAEATFTTAQVEQALLGSQAGSIVLLHMNHPRSGTGEGVARAIPQLRDRGLRFVQLGEHQRA